MCSLPSKDVVFSDIRYGKTNKVINYIQNGFDINSKDVRGTSILVEAVKQEHVNLAKYLLHNKALVNEPDIYGRTALFWAAGNKDKELVEELISRGADVNYKCSHNRTPLFWGASNNTPEVCEILLKREVNIDHKDNQGQTPLMKASFWGNLDAANFLIERGANLNVGDNNQNTALCLAKQNKKFEIMEVLHRREGQWRPIEDESISGSFMSSVRRLQIEDIERLLEDGDLVNVKDASGNPPIIIAVKLSKNASEAALEKAYRIVILLLNNGARVCDDMLNISPESLICNAFKASQHWSLLEPLLHAYHGLALPASNVAIQQDTSMRQKYQRVIYLERQIHNDNYLQICNCLREQYGRNPITQKLTKVLKQKDKSKCANVLEDKDRPQSQSSNIFGKLWQRLNNSPYYLFGYIFSIHFLFPFSIYYVDLVLDIMVAVELTKRGSTAKWLSWALVVVPSSGLGLFFCMKGSSMLSVGIKSYQGQEFYETKAYGMDKYSFIASSYNSKPRAVFLFLFQLWPCLAYFQNAILLLKIRSYELKSILVVSEMITSHQQSFYSQLLSISEWNSLVEGSLQFLIGLLSHAGGNISVALILKIVMTPLSLTFFLLREEISAKLPVQINFYGKINLSLSFLWMVIARLWCILEFLRDVSFTRLLGIYGGHIVIVMLIQFMDEKRYDAGEKFLLKFKKCMFSIFNYVPYKPYDRNVRSIGRVLFQLLLFLETVIMAYFIFISRRGDSMFVLGCVFLFLGFSYMHRIIYYKWNHPWKWRVSLLPNYWKQSVSGLNY